MAEEFELYNPEENISEVAQVRREKLLRRGRPAATRSVYQGLTAPVLKRYHKQL